VKDSSGWVVADHGKGGAVVTRLRKAWVSILLGALLTLLVAVPAETLSPMHHPKGTFAIKECNKIKYKPYMFTVGYHCYADSGIYARHSHWLYWHRTMLGERWAKANTKVYIDNCVPDCAGGHYHHRRAMVWLTARGWCPKAHHYVYRLQLIRYTGPEVGIGPDIRRWPHGWHWLGCPGF
jgi:hypothetical protein